MAVRIHHTQVKQAAKLGIQLEVDGDTVIAFKDKNDVEHHGYGAKAPEAMADLFKKLGTTTADLMKSLKTPEQKLADGKKQIVKAKKARKVKVKKPKFTCTNCGEHKYESDGEEDGGFVCSSCGEPAEIEQEEDNGRSVIKKKYKRAYKPFKGKCGDTLAEKITAHVMVKHEGDKKYHVDPDRLKAFAKANGVWDPAFVGRNNGLVRMTMRNRLQGKLNRKEIKVEDIKWPA